MSMVSGRCGEEPWRLRPVSTTNLPRGRIIYAMWCMVIAKFIYMCVQLPSSSFSSYTPFKHSTSAFFEQLSSHILSPLPLRTYNSPFLFFLSHLLAVFSSFLLFLFCDFLILKSFLFVFIPCKFSKQILAHSPPCTILTFKARSKYPR
jgi:hypothetical protein